MDSVADVVNQDEDHLVEMLCDDDLDIVDLIKEESTVPISNTTVGPENGAVRCLFKVVIRQFLGQRLQVEEEPIVWLVRAHSIEAFQSYLWELAAPHIKQPVVIETDPNGVVTSVGWGDPGRPTMDQAEQYILFCDRKTRRNYNWSQMNNLRLEKWHKSSTLFLCIHEYSLSLSSKAVYELVQDKLLKPLQPQKPPKPKAQQSRSVLLPPEADGYSFQDEVRAVRETFLQMRDLMVILDNRISLLERKCEQTIPGESTIQIKTTKSDVTTVKSFTGDPLLFEVIKEEDEHSE